MNLQKEKLLQFFSNALKVVSPKNLLQQNINLPPFFYVFGSGKAAATMANTMEELYFPRILGGTVVSNMEHVSLQKIRHLTSSHPIPTHLSLEAGETLCLDLEKLEPHQHFVYLLSGGTSALIEKLNSKITLEDMQNITYLLLQKGATIQELNTVRKHLSSIKGGKLAQNITAQGTVFVISDVVGDDLSTIGSGILYSDYSSSEQAKQILVDYEIWNGLTKEIQKTIEASSTLKENKQNIQHVIIGNNELVLRNLQQQWQEQNIPAYIINAEMEGEAREIAQSIAKKAKKIVKTSLPYPIPVCLLFGGETTVTVTGTGKGGRNQELALAILSHLKNAKGIYVLCAGTDGIDGNTDAAGAIVSSEMYNKSEIEKYLANNDSYHFFRKHGGLISTGKTGTNVVDIVMVLIANEASFK